VPLGAGGLGAIASRLMQTKAFERKNTFRRIRLMLHVHMPFDCMRQFKQSTHYTKMG